MDKYFRKIEEGQKKSGGFFDSKNIESIFYTSLILSCLGCCKETLQVKVIKQKSASFLISQKKENWIFSENAGVEFCVLSALADYDREIINAEAIGKVLKNLIAIESREGGPYYSHFGGSEERADEDIDLATNSIIACFLYSLEVELPNLTELFESAILKKDFRSVFCSNIYLVIYFISRSYRGERKNNLIEFILSCKNKEKYWDNPLNAAMAVISLLNFNYPAEKLGRELEYFKNLPEEELFKAYSLEKDNFSTSELNFAFYLAVTEKLNKEKDDIKSIEYSESCAAILNKEEKEMLEKILLLARNRFSNLQIGIKNIAIQEIQKTINGNLDKQMPLMPFWFKKTLGRKAERISDDLVVQLGLMNVFFWTAFIIYDDFWDEEGIPKILPAANLYARNFISFFNGILAHNLDFNLFFRELMDKLDGSNAEILTNFRLKVEGCKILIPENIPDYGNYEIIYGPSSAHILGPAVMLYELGYRSDSFEMKNLINYFRNYLIAMQINDDLCDWEEDLRRGHLSTVVVMLLNDLGRNGNEIDIERDIIELKNIFWSRTLPKACIVAIRHTEKSRQALKKIGILENSMPLENIVNTIERAVKTVLEEQKYTQDFLKAYNE